MSRHVRKGQKGIAILAPNNLQVKPAIEQHHGSNSTAEALIQLVGFRRAYVFDIARTNRQDLLEFATVKGDRQHLAQLKTFA